MSPSRRGREPLTSVDAAWLHMDTPSNLAIITGVITFPAPIDFARLRLTVERRMLVHKRFRQRIHPASSPIGLPLWEYDPDFDIDYHLSCDSLPEPADLAALQTYVGEKMSEPLDNRRPLWRFIYIDHMQGGGAALVARLHHCIADGMALVGVMLSIMDDEPDAALPPPLEEPAAPRRPGLAARVFRPVARAAHTAGKARRMAVTLAFEGLDHLVHPSRIGDTARMGVSATRSLAKLLLIGPDRRSPLKGRCGVPKRAAWSSDLDLEEVKAIGRRMGGTVNDILLSAVTGGLRRYIESRGAHTEGLNVRAVVPVNLRPPGDDDELGNRFGLVFLSLPVGIQDPLKRLVTLRRRMNEIKDTPEAIVAFGILGAIGMTPTQIEHIIVSVFGMKGTAVMTNVPGPRQPLYFAGGRVDTLMFWVPTPGNLGLGVSIISYAGRVILGIATDEGLVPDPENIVSAFAEEMEYLKNWGRPH